MTRRTVLAALVGIVAATVAYAAYAQSSSQPSSPAPAYTPAVPSGSQYYGGGYGGYYSPGTAAGSAMQGMASVVSAAGSYNLSTSAAAVNYSQARKQEIQNYDAYVNTYFDTRKVNREARAAELGPALSREQMVRLAQDSAPKSLSASQLDPVDGVITWPALLQDEKYESERALLEKAFAYRAHHGGLNLAQVQKVQEATSSLLGQLRQVVRDVEPMLYSQAKNFVQSLAYEAGKPTS